MGGGPLARSPDGFLSRPAGAGPSAAPAAGRGADGRIRYCASRSMVVPSNTLLTVRTAHILPHMVQVPSVEAGEAS